jgi:transposase
MDRHDRRGRKYSAEEKAAAVRMVGTLRAELGTNQGTVQRVATQLSCGLESAGHVPLSGVIFLHRGGQLF